MSADGRVDSRKLMDEFKKPIDDTHTLINMFAMRDRNDAYSGVPLVLAVEQIHAMREAICHVRSRLYDCDAAITALPNLFAADGDVSSLPRERKREHDERLSSLKREQRRLTEELRVMGAKLEARRDDQIERLATDLHKAVDAYDRTFDDLVRPKGEGEMLAKLVTLCAPFTADALAERGESLPRQPEKIGPPHLVRTLLNLAERADVIGLPGGPLDRVTRRAAAAGGPGCYVEIGPVKGFRRAMEKAHQEYGGNYLMVNDMARCSIVVPRMSNLYDVTRWLLEQARPLSETEEEMPGFVPLVVKDRSSPTFDAEAHGLYRYVLLVAQIECDGTSLPINVEIVLHVKRLFELKKQLHTLYEHQKALGDDETNTHDGALTDEVMRRARKGIVRKLKCVHPKERVSEIARDALAETLKLAPCHVMHLELTGCGGLEGLALGDGLLLPAGGDSLACTKLRVLKLARLSLGGEIPKALSRCVWLNTLELQDNWLHGHIPDAIGKLKQLETLALHGNALDGNVPADALCQLTKLATLTLGGELGGNDELRIQRSQAARLETALPDAEVYLPTLVVEDAPKDEANPASTPAPPDKSSIAIGEVPVVS